jgi:hypothetical protein
MIDFTAIKARHRIEDVLARRSGIELRRASGGYQAKCPIHGEQKGHSFTINEKKQTWRCFGKCQTGGSVIDLIIALDGAADARAAAEILEGRALTTEEKTRPRIKPTRTTPLHLTDERTQRRLLTPLPTMLRADQLKHSPRHYFDLIATARQLHWVAIQMAHDAGTLRFCNAQWHADGEKFPCYAILDIENPINVQFRRLDPDETGRAKCFWADTKVMGWKGNQGNWPVGIDNALRHPKSTLLLVEGTGDFLAAWDIRNQGIDIIPIGIFGASNSISPAALPFFERRKVLIIEQHDPAAAQATARWQQQLTAAQATVTTWQVPEPGADLNDHITAGYPLPII